MIRQTERGRPGNMNFVLITITMDNLFMVINFLALISFSEIFLCRSARVNGFHVLHICGFCLAPPQTNYVDSSSITSLLGGSVLRSNLWADFWIENIFLLLLLLCYVMNMNKNVVYARHRERCLNVEQTATSLRSLSLACSLLCLIVQLHDVSCLFLDCCAMLCSLDHYYSLCSKTLNMAKELHSK